MQKFGNYTVKSEIGQGSFGQIYSVTSDQGNVEYALKCEPKDLTTPTIFFEAKILKSLSNSKYFPTYVNHGSTSTHNYLVMSLHENSLDKILIKLGKTYFSISTGLRIAKHLLNALQDLHECNLIHRDLKPSNILINKNPSIILSDFGMVRVYSQNGEHLPPRNKPGFRGSLLYSSIHAHQGNELSRRDDLISWFYVITHLITGTLPWIHAQEQEDFLRFKKNFNPYFIWVNIVPEMIEIWKLIDSLSYSQAPNYNSILQIIERAMIRLNIFEFDSYDWMIDNKQQSENVVKEISIKGFLNGNDEDKFCCFNFLTIFL